MGFELITFTDLQESMLPYDQITQFNIGPVVLQAWGTMVALGFIVGILVALREGKRVGYNIDHLLNIAILAFGGSLIGSRLMYVALFPEEFSGPVSVMKIWNGGMVYYGGFILALALILWYIKAKKLNFWKAADIVAPGLAIGLAIGRLGCHMIRDHIGEITTVPWAVEWGGEIRHETAMYCVIANFVGFLLIWFWWRKKDWFDGAVFLLYLIWYSVTRFIIDFFRASDIPTADPRFFDSVYFKGLTISQLISIGIIAIAIYFLIRLRDKQLTSGEKVIS